jgi:hypothetical protein
MHRKGLTTVALLVLAGVAAAAAVAGGQTITKEQVIQRGGAICRAAERQVEATPAPKSQNPFAKTAPAGDRTRALKFIAVYASSLTNVRTGLARLVPLSPPRDRPLLASFVNQLGPTIAAFRAAHAAAVSHQYHRALADVQRGFALFGRASAKTKAYGFPRGVCQAGSS